MAEKEPLIPSVEKVWGARWDIKASAKQLFLHRLFIEGYPIFKKYIPKNAGTILEVGAGSGRYGLMFAQEFPHSKIIESDLVPESLAAILRATIELGLDNVEIQPQNVLAMTTSSDSVDVVFCDGVIQHIPEPAKGMTEMARILKPGGILIFSSVNKWNIPHQGYKHVYLPLVGKPYPYGYEKNYSHRELVRLAQIAGLNAVANDGFYAAYGVYRWKIHHASWWGIVGGALNRISRVLDTLTGRAFSRNFGFEIFVVARKPLN